MNALTMIPGPMGITILVLYTVGCLFFVYYCVVSDPQSSEITHCLQITLPATIWNRLRPILGDNGVDFLQRLSERTLVLAYFLIVGGCWSVVFGHMYPWLLFESPTVSNVHAIIGIIVFVVCFTAWGVANNSRPGIITARSLRRYDHYPYDNLLFQSNTICETTRIFKIPRCKFDRMKYNGLVPRYDHYCGWTNNTYGEENYRWFLLFLLQHVIMCFYGTYVSSLLFMAEIETKRLMDLTFFDRVTGESIKASYSIVFQYLFARRTMEVGVMLVMFLMGIALALFLGYHVYITSIGQTTNENGKWGDVKQWHKKQRRLYETAVREGRVKPESSLTTESSESEEGDSDDEDTVDPGPFPKNVYNRGFVENWKEVFFPMSLRADAMSQGGYTYEWIQRRRQQAMDRAKGKASPVPVVEESPTEVSSKRKDA